MIKLREITRGNVLGCIGLRVAAAQRRFVAPNVYSLAQAWVMGRAACPFAVYAGDVMVGFVMVGYYKKMDVYGVRRLMIDQKHQSKGYGRAALRLAVGYLARETGVRSVYLSYSPDNKAAEALYASEGFVRVGELERYGEILMRLDL